MIINAIYSIFPSLKRDYEKLNAERSDLLAQLDNNRYLIGHLKSPYLFKSSNTLLADRLINHAVSELSDDIKLFSIGACNEYKDRTLVAQRLINAYHKAIADEISSPLRREEEDMWTGLLRTELPDLIESVEEKNAERLANFLFDFGSSYVWFGGITTCVDGYTKGFDDPITALVYKDKLVDLAEAVGAINLENPEVGLSSERIKIAPETLVNAIEDKIGIDIKPPMGIIHTDGIKVKDYILHYRHLNALYSAFRLSQIDGVKEATCEYGGGLGLTAFYSRKLGITDYTIFDLPITNLLAGHFLIHACGQESVCLYGEPKKSGTIKLLPYWECLNEGSHFTSALNQDSFPEISEKLVQVYLNQISNMVQGPFLSINHECFYPNTVNNAVTKFGRFRLGSRTKNWLRQGYVEEVYWPIR